jgi:hypothetical protein
MKDYAIDEKLIIKHIELDGNHFLGLSLENLLQEVDQKYRDGWTIRPTNFRRTPPCFSIR